MAITSHPWLLILSWYNLPMLSGATLIYSLMVVIGDFLAIIIGFALAYLLRVTLGVEVGGNGEVTTTIEAVTYIKAFFVITPVWLLVFHSLKLYASDIYFNRYREFARLFLGTFLGILIVIGYEFFTNETIFPGRLIAIYGFSLAYVLLLLERQIIRWFRQRLFRFGRGISRVVLIGSTEATKYLAKLFSGSTEMGYEVVAIVGSDKVVPKKFAGKHFTVLSEALKSLDDLDATMIVQTEFFESRDKNKKILNQANKHHLAYRFIPTQEEFYTGNHTVDIFHGYPVVAVHQTALIGTGRIVKRLFDIAVASVALIVLSPFMLIVALANLIQDGRPVLFKQKRLSRYNQHIHVYKFRSMRKEFSGKNQEKAFRSIGRDDLADQYLKVGHQVDFGEEEDVRITKLGRLWRASSIDELPQLWNVIKGDISLVGPRAIVPEELKFFKDLGPKMLYVKTGITGLAQVSGRSDISHEERAKLNAYYVNNWSFWLDIKIIFKTIRLLLTGKGVR